MATNKLCARLRTFGVDARPAPLGQPEEGFDNGYSEGLIYIDNSPIRWVNLRWFVPMNERAEYTNYGIPDHRPIPRVSLEATVNTLPAAFWRGFGVHWEVISGDDHAKNIAKSLTDDKAIILGVTVTAKPEYGCWIISVFDRRPSRKMWVAYEKIAASLLAMPMSGDWQ